MSVIYLFKNFTTLTSNKDYRKKKKKELNPNYYIQMC